MQKRAFDSHTKECARTEFKLRPFCTEYASWLFDFDKRTIRYALIRRGE
jgi:hypothetical protein